MTICIALVTDLVSYLRRHSKEISEFEDHKPQEVQMTTQHNTSAKGRQSEPQIEIQSKPTSLSKPKPTH